MGWGGRGTYFLIIFYDNKTWNLCQRFCQKDPVLPAGSHRGGLSSGLTWLGWAEGEGSVVGSEGRLWSLCTCRALGKRGFGARMGNFHPPGVQLLPCLSPSQLPWAAPCRDGALALQGVAHRSSDPCLNKQDSNPFKHFRSKNFKLFSVKYVVSQDWEFIFSFVYYVLQKGWYSP